MWKAHYRHQTGHPLLLSHLQSCRMKFERSDIICSCQGHAGCLSALPAAPNTLPFALAPMEFLSPWQLFCQPAEVPSTDDISLLPVGCSYYSLDLPSSHFDLHFLFTCFFPNILMFFYLLRKLMQRLSCLASNYIPPLCLLPQFLLIAVSVFFPLSLVLQTTLWFVLFFFLSKDPHSYSYHL